MLVSSNEVFSHLAAPLQPKTENNIAAPGFYVLLTDCVIQIKHMLNVYPGRCRNPGRNPRSQIQSEKLYPYTTATSTLHLYEEEQTWASH